MNIGRREFVIAGLGVVAVGAVTGGVSCLMNDMKNEVREALLGDVEKRFVKLTGMLRQAKQLIDAYPDACTRAGVTTNFDYLEANVVVPVMELVRQGKLTNGQVRYVDGLFHELSLRLEEALAMQNGKNRIEWLGIGDTAHYRDLRVTLATVLALRGDGALPVHFYKDRTSDIRTSCDRLAELMRQAEQVQRSDPQRAIQLGIRTDFWLEQCNDEALVPIIKLAKNGSLSEQDAAAVHRIFSVMIEGLERALEDQQADRMRALAKQDGRRIRDAVTALHAARAVIEKSE